MEISKRLETIVSQISFRNLADIGTDHAYIPIYAKKTNIIDRAIAVDISKGSLLKATENIEKYGFKGIIEIKQGNGLIPIESFGAECISIAGMGGMLIIDILKNSPKIVAASKQLVLQPQKDIPLLRRYIHSVGFKILNEEMVLEDKYYTVLNCIHGTDQIYNEQDYLFGKILLDRKDEVLYSFFLTRIKELEKIMSLMKKDNSNENDLDKSRLKDLSERLNNRMNEIINEVQLCKRLLSDINRF